jgi:hypothetical protein
MLNLLAKARAMSRLPSLVPLSRLFHTVLNAMRFGEHRGGMFVRARGRRDGKPTELSWHLIAEGDDGPFIPSMAIEGIIRKLLRGQRPEAGARAGTRALELADYDTLFKGRAIFTGFRIEEDGRPFYREMLGAAFDTLPSRVQELHGTCEPRQWKGHADVLRGRGLIARLIGRVMGFPESGSHVPVAVMFSPVSGGERWTRNFGGNVFSSVLSPGRGKNAYLLVERFGAVSVAMALVIEEKRLNLIPRRWSFLGMPLPKSLMPSGTSFETEVDGQFHFNVEISAPIVGLIASYNGTLLPRVR